MILETKCKEGSGNMISCLNSGVKLPAVSNEKNACSIYPLLLLEFSLTKLYISAISWT